MLVDSLAKHYRKHCFYRGNPAPSMPDVCPPHFFFLTGSRSVLRGHNVYGAITQGRPKHLHISWPLERWIHLQVWTLFSHISTRERQVVRTSLRSHLDICSLGCFNHPNPLRSRQMRNMHTCLQRASIVYHFTNGALFGDIRLPYGMSHRILPALGP